MKNCLLLFALASVQLVAAQPNFVMEKQLTASGSAAGDQVGYATHMYKNKFIVGAPRNDKDVDGNTVNDVGAAYVHERSATGVWTEHKLSAPYGYTTDLFGSSVSVSDSFAVVGAPWHDYYMFSPTVHNNIGAAYIYKRDAATGDWEFFQKLGPHGVGPSEDIYNPDDWFGQSVSISGNTIVVGALYHDYDDVNTFMSNCGAAFVFEWDEINGQFEYKTKLFIPFADRADDDVFGTSAQVQGNTIVVGAPGQDKDPLGFLTDQGAAYVFEKDGTGNWVYAQKLNAPNIPGLGAQREAMAYFGTAVAIHDRDILVSAPFQDHGAGFYPAYTDQGCVYAFFEPFTGYTYGAYFYCPAGQANAYYGSAIAIQENKMIIGGHAHDLTGSMGADYGRVDLYTRGYFGDTWQSLIPTNGYEVSPQNTSDNFGKGVGVYGNKFIAGAPNYDLDALGNSVSNVGAGFVFCGPLNFATPPSDKTICQGDSTMFIVDVDNAVQLQWSVSVDGVSWTPLTNNTFYSGVNNDTLMVMGVLLSMNNLMYSCTATNECGTGISSSNDAVLHVNALPSITFTLADDVCSIASSISLSAFPGGGSFSGTAVSGSNFSPSAAGAGVFTISYTYTDMGTGCTNVETEDITVHGPPTVSFTLPDDQVCSTEASFTLTGASPAGGTFSGSGVTSGTTFNPGMVGTGTYPLMYTYTDGFGCMNSISDNMTVITGPLATLFLSPDEVCSSAGTVSLSGGLPAGGVFSGTGVTGTSTFDPAIAGVGVTTLVYTYTDGSSGCTDTASADITVIAGPSVGLTLASNELCSDDAAVTLSGGTPAGGAYTGTGVSGGSFNPVTAGVGTHTITYTFTDAGSGCTGTATQDITVDDCSGINEISLEKVISIYPNPAGNLVQVTTKNVELQEITIWNEMGQQVVLVPGTGQNAVTINTSQLSAGMYTLSILTPMGNSRKKLLVTH